MRHKKLLAVGALLALTGFIVAAWAVEQGPPINQTPIDFESRLFAERAADRMISFQPDTQCACVSDAINGPTVSVFMGTQAILGVRANSGSCSLLVVQVSMNDTNWVSTPSNHFQITSINSANSSASFTKGDSLNAGGYFVSLLPIAGSLSTTTQGIPWQFARLQVTRFTGYTTTTASAGPTVACRARLDSLRFTSLVVGRRVGGAR